MDGWSTVWPRRWSGRLFALGIATFALSAATAQAAIVLEHRGTYRDGQGGLKLNEATGIDVIPSEAGSDQTYVVATAWNGGTGALNLLRRDTTSGALTPVQTLIDDQGGVDGLSFATRVSVTKGIVPRGIFVTGQGENEIGIFQLDSGATQLKYLGTVADGAGGVPSGALSGPLGIDAADFSLYVAANDGGAFSLFEVGHPTRTLEHVKTQFSPDFAGAWDVRADAESFPSQVYATARGAETLTILPTGLQNAGTSIHMSNANGPGGRPTAPVDIDLGSGAFAVAGDQTGFFNPSTSFGDLTPSREKLDSTKTWELANVWFTLSWHGLVGSNFEDGGLKLFEVVMEDFGNSSVIQTITTPAEVMSQPNDIATTTAAGGKIDVYLSSHGGDAILHYRLIDTEEQSGGSDSGSGEEGTLSADCRKAKRKLRKARSKLQSAKQAKRRAKKTGKKKKFRKAKKKVKRVKKKVKKRKRKRRRACR